MTLLPQSLSLHGYQLQPLLAWLQPLAQLRQLQLDQPVNIEDLNALTGHEGLTRLEVNKQLQSMLGTGRHGTAPGAGEVPGPVGGGHAGLLGAWAGQPPPAPPSAQQAQPPPAPLLSPLQLTQLRALHARVSGPDLLASLAPLTGLVELSVAIRFQLGYSRAEAGLPNALLALTALTDLTSFACNADGCREHDADLTDDVMEGLAAAWRRLAAFGFTGDVQLTPAAGFGALRRLGGLRRLELAHTGRGQLVVPAAALPAGLQALSLCRAVVRHDGAGCLPAVSELSLRACRWEVPWAGGAGDWPLLQEQQEQAQQQQQAGECVAAEAPAASAMEVEVEAVVAGAGGTAAAAGSDGSTLLLQEHLQEGSAAAAAGAGALPVAVAAAPAPPAPPALPPGMAASGAISYAAKMYGAAALAGPLPQHWKQPSGHSPAAQAAWLGSANTTAAAAATVTPGTSSSGTAVQPHASSSSSGSSRHNVFDTRVSKQALGSTISACSTAAAAASTSSNKTSVPGGPGAGYVPLEATLSPNGPAAVVCRISSSSVTFSSSGPSSRPGSGGGGGGSSQPAAAAGVQQLAGSGGGAASFLELMGRCQARSTDSTADGWGSGATAPQAAAAGGGGGGGEGAGGAGAGGVAAAAGAAGGLCPVPRWDLSDVPVQVGMAAAGDTDVAPAASAISCSSAML